MKLFMVVFVMMLLAVLLGYILGSRPIVTTTLNEGAKPASQQSVLNEPDSEIGNARVLPSYDSLLASPTTTPLPLSLQAGVFYDAGAADLALQKLKEINTNSAVMQFSGVNDQTLNVVILGPFENEANLQLAQYQLSSMKITSQRVVTPKAISN